MLIYATRMSILIASVSFMLTIFALWLSGLFSYLWNVGTYTFIIFMVSFLCFIICSILEAKGVRVSYATRRRREPTELTFASKHKEQDKPMA